MKTTYNCPKCHCNCLFEDKNKLVCMNCGAEVSAQSARGVRHEHHYETYTVRNTDRPVTVPKTSAVPKPTASVFPANTERPISARHTAKPQKKRIGCGFWILLYILFSILLPLLRNLF